MSRIEQPGHLRRGRISPVGLWVALGSGAGGGARVIVVLVTASLFGDGFPYGILVVNVLGSFLIGLLAALTARGGGWLLSPFARQGLMAGFCGGFTTFSFFSLQTLELLHAARWLEAAIYLFGTLLFCLLAVWLGYLAGRKVCATGDPGIVRG